MKKYNITEPVQKSFLSKSFLGKITTYGFRIGIGMFLLFPPYIIWWKDYSMDKMGSTIKDDIIRMRSKGKTLYDIPRKYEDHELKIRDKDFFKDYKKEVELQEDDKQFLEQIKENQQQKL